MKFETQFEAYRAHLDSLVSDGTIDAGIAAADLAMVKHMIDAGDPDAENMLQICRTE